MCRRLARSWTTARPMGRRIRLGRVTPRQRVDHPAVPWKDDAAPSAMHPAGRASARHRSRQLALAVRDDIDVVVKLDADVDFEPALLRAVLSGVRGRPAARDRGWHVLRREDGAVGPTRVTEATVWGATRAYRSDCLNATSSPSSRAWVGRPRRAHGQSAARWDTTCIDSSLPAIPHAESGASAPRCIEWTRSGWMARYMGYRPSYLAARSLFRSLEEPRAIAMIWGFAAATVEREPVYPDPAVRGYLRSQQRLRLLPMRIREARGRAR